MQSVGKATDLFFFSPLGLWFLDSFTHWNSVTSVDCLVRKKAQKQQRWSSCAWIFLQRWWISSFQLSPTFFKTALCSYPSLNGASNFPSHVHLLSFIPPDFADADEALSFLTSCLAFRVSSQVVLHRQLPACLYFTFSWPCLRMYVFLLSWALCNSWEKKKTLMET